MQDWEIIIADDGSASRGSYGVVYLLARRRPVRSGLLESRHTRERTKIAGEAFGAIPGTHRPTGRLSFARNSHRVLQPSTMLR